MVEGDSDEMTEEYSAIQTFLDELSDDDVFVIATAKDITKIPDSLLRLGRFEEIIKTRWINSQIGLPAVYTKEYRIINKV